MIKPVTYEQLCEDVVRVKKLVGDADLTVVLYLKHGKFTKHQLRKFGGLAAIAADILPPTLQDLGVVRGQHHRASYVSKLEKELGDREYFTKEITKKLEELFTKQPVVLNKPKPVIKFKHSSSSERENVALLSDWHLGLEVFNDEVPSNTYNWKIGARRFGKMVDQISTYKIEDRQNSQRLRLCLNGDMGQGVIHPEMGTDLIAYQIDGITKYLVQGVDYLRNFYKEITIETSPCNHMRIPKVPDGGSDMSQKYNSYATMVHMNLKSAFRNVPEVKVNIVKTPFTEFKVFDHLFFMTHGDSVLKTGNVGKTVEVGRLATHLLQIQSSTPGKHYACALWGHVHKPLLTETDFGTTLVINGSGSGVDTYAQSIGYTANNPCQVLFESTPDYAVGDFRIIRLKDADKESRYEQIITPYDRVF